MYSPKRKRLFRRAYHVFVYHQTLVLVGGGGGGGPESGGGVANRLGWGRPVALLDIFANRYGKVGTQWCISVLKVTDAIVCIW